MRHIVLLRFTPEATAADIARIEAGFVALRHGVDSVRAIEWGRNESPEALDKGFTHAFVVHFDDAAGRDAYLPHPAHQAFVASLRPWLADVLVIDYLPRTEP